jgi:hypothetical protein
MGNLFLQCRCQEGTATENLPFSEPSLGCHVERFFPVAMPSTNFLNKNTKREEIGKDKKKEDIVTVH